MRKLKLLLLFLAPVMALAQEPSWIDQGRHHWVRLDYGIAAAGCQGSYLPPVDWSQLNPNQVSKPTRHTYSPTVYYELEVRPHARYSVLAHYDRWANSRWKQQGNGGWSYHASAETYLLGGRWYWGKHLRMYSGLMGGWSHHWGRGTGVPRVNDSDFAHQITFIGLRTGGVFGITAELGQGYKGFFAFGLSLAL